MRFALVALVTGFLASPAIAEPRLDASMPVIRSSIASGEMVVRLDQGVLGSARSLAPRTVVLVGKDASGQVLAETTTPVSRRLSYARLPLTPALAGASTISILVR